jgi:hypothetical protein
LTNIFKNGIYKYMDNKTSKKEKKKTIESTKKKKTRVYTKEEDDALVNAFFEGQKTY